MTSSDERELHRLTGMLEAIDRGLEIDSPLHEALQKAGITLTLGFLKDLRPEIDKQFSELGAEPTDSQRAHLRRICINPESR